MGVFLSDRLTGDGLGLSNLLWLLLGQSLASLGAPHLDDAFVRDGYVPSWLGRTWGSLLFDQLGDLVVVCRPARGSGGDMRPVAVYRRGSPAALSWARHGEQLSVYELPCAPVMLGFAQFCSAGTGYAATTLRPAARGTPVSDVAARVMQIRSGLFPPARGRATRPSRPSERRTA